MTKNELNMEYFKWLQLVCQHGRYRSSSYQKLLTKIHNTDFTYTIGMDGNRAEDGMNLRYRFGYDKGYESAMIASYLDNHPCSILEMLVALAMRCEDSIMYDPDIGDRTGEWFWGMIENLGLTFADDRDFDRYLVDLRIDQFLNRKYMPNGSGGLFTIPGCKDDLRRVEIWYQMCWYMDYILSRRRTL